MPHFGLEQFAPYVLYFGGIAAFFASFRRPWIGLYLLALTLPLQTIRFRLVAFPLGSNFVDIVLLGVIIGALSRDGIRAFKTPLTAILIVLAAFYYFSLWQGASYLNLPLPLSFEDRRLSSWKNYVELFLVCIVTASVIKDKAQAQGLLVVMAVSVLLVNKGYFGAVADRDFSHFSHESRYAGTLGYAGENGLASFEAIMAAFFLGIAAYVKRLRVKLAIFALVLTCIYCILFTFSREAYLGFLASLTLLGILKDKKLLVAVATVLIAWQTILPNAVQERIEMTTQETGYGEELDASSASRVTLWKDALNLFPAAPVLGFGFNTYEFMGRVGPYRDTHNYYIKLLLETGAVGLLLFLWLLGRMWVLGYSLFRRAVDPFWASVGLGFLGAMCSLTIVNCFGDRWTYQQLNGHVWILMGCVMRGLAITRETVLQAEESDDEALPVPEEMESGVLTA